MDYDFLKDDYTRKIRILYKAYKPQDMFGFDVELDEQEITLYFLETHKQLYCLERISGKDYTLNISKIDSIYDKLEEYNCNSFKFYEINGDNTIQLVRNDEDRKILSFTNLYIDSRKILDEFKYKEISYIDFMINANKHKSEDTKRDYINEFLIESAKHFTNPFNKLRERFILGDGTQISIQASFANYCEPRTSNALKYDSVECGFPTRKIEELLPYAEEPDSPTNTVYGYVPVSVINEIIEKYGIDKDFAKKYNLDYDKNIKNKGDEK